jgi:hypothetical protein
VLAGPPVDPIGAGGICLLSAVTLRLPGANRKGAAVKNWQLTVDDDGEGWLQWRLTEDGKTPKTGIWRLPEDSASETYQAFFTLVNLLDLA